MNAARFLGVMAAVFVALAALYFTAFVAGWGQPIERSDALWEVQVVKTRIATDTPSPRWLIVGGSSAWFGFDSELLTRATGRQVVNLGLHAEVPLWFQLEQVAQQARTGDAVILAAELVHYWRAHPTTYGATKLSVLAPDLLTTATWRQRWELLMATPPSHVMARLLAKAEHEPQFSASRAQELFTGVAARWAGVSRGEVPDYYNALELTPRGDFGRLRSAADHRRENYDLAATHEVATQVWRDLAAMQRRLDAKGARCMFAWPPVEQHAGVDFHSGQVESNLRDIKDRLTAAGWREIGTPEEAIFASEFFYDTGYHLTTEGARERTRRLIESARRGGILPVP